MFTRQYATKTECLDKYKQKKGERRDFIPYLSPIKLKIISFRINLRNQESVSIQHSLTWLSHQ